MSKALVIILGVVTVLTVAWQGFPKPQPPALPTPGPEMVAKSAQAETDFIREGSRLSEDCRWGVDYTTFGDQMQRTIGAFHLAEDGMRQSNERRRLRFERELGRWEATRILWVKKLKGKDYFKRDDAAWREALIMFGEPQPEEEDAPPAQIRFDDEADTPSQDPHRVNAASLAKIVHLGLRKGDEAFQEAMSR